MPIIEQSTVIRAPLTLVMEVLGDVASIPSWATVEGAIDQIRGEGVGMTYRWRYTFNGLECKGHSQVIEQTERALITRTDGDINSLWTISLTPLGMERTAIQVVVEYVSPKMFIELLADLVMQQLSDSGLATENMERFKQRVEVRARTAEEQLVVDHR
jgi:uncharacterized membrane protein